MIRESYTRDLICLAEDFNEWLEYMDKKYNLDKDAVQEIIKLWLM